MLNVFNKTTNIFATSCIEQFIEFNLSCLSGINIYKVEVKLTVLFLEIYVYLYSI